MAGVTGSALLPPYLAAVTSLDVLLSRISEHETAVLTIVMNVFEFEQVRNPV